MRRDRSDTWIGGQLVPPIKRRLSVGAEVQPDGLAAVRRVSGHGVREAPDPRRLIDRLRRRVRHASDIDGARVRLTNRAAREVDVCHPTAARGGAS